MIKVLEALAARLAKDPQEFVSSLYKDDKKEELIEESAIIGLLEKALSEKITAHNQDQKNRGVKEGRKAFESWIKSKGFDSDLKGVDLLEAWHDEISQKPAEKDKDLTKEAAAKLPVVKELIDERLKAASDKLQQTETEFLTFKRNAQLSEIKSTAQKRAADILEKNRVILEAEGVPKSKRLDTIFSLIDYDHLKVEGDKVVLIDNEGDVLKDDFGNPVTFENYILDKNPFQIRQQDPSKGSPPPKVPGAPPASATEVRDVEHYNELMSKATTAVQRIAISEAWDKKQNS